MAERLRVLSRTAVDVLMAGSAVMAACGGAKSQEVRQTPAATAPVVAAPRPTASELGPRVTVTSTVVTKETPVTPQAPRPSQATAPSGEIRALALDGNRDALVFKGVGGLEKLPLEIRSSVRREDSRLSRADVIVSKEGEFTLSAASADCPGDGMAFKVGNGTVCGPSVETGKTVDVDVSFSGSEVVFNKDGREVTRAKFEASIPLTQGDLVVGASSVNRLTSPGAFKGQIARVEIVSGGKIAFGTNFEEGSFKDRVNGIEGTAIDDAKLVQRQ